MMAHQHFFDILARVNFAMIGGLAIVAIVTAIRDRLR
jgi:hypothetical protein